jgi:hypothetical protein cdivTM_11337
LIKSKYKKSIGGILVVGNVKNEIGLMFSKDNFMLVKKALKKGEKVEKHNHENEEIIFTVLKGKVEVFLNEKENHVLVPGEILQFDGINFISAVAMEDSEFSVTLIKK